MSSWEETKRQITESQVWQSIFRHGYDDTARNRVMMVSGNIWLHLHPSKVRRHAVRMRFTWCVLPCRGMGFPRHRRSKGLILSMLVRPTRSLWKNLVMCFMVVRGETGELLRVAGTLFSSQNMFVAFI